MEKFKMGNGFIDSMKHSMCLRNSELIIDSFDDSDMVTYSYYLGRLVELQSKYPNVRKKEIKLLINSNGGSVVNLFSLHDKLKILESQGWIIKAVSESRAYSAGFFTLISASKGFRYAYKNSDLLLHSQNWFEYGHKTVGDLRKQHESNEKLLKKIKKLVYEYTNITDEQFEKYIDGGDDWEMSAEEALELGVIDKIL